MRKHSKAETYWGVFSNCAAGVHTTATHIALHYIYFEHDLTKGRKKKDVSRVYNSHTGCSGIMTSLQHDLV